MFAPGRGARVPSGGGRSGGGRSAITVLGIDPGLTRCGYAVLKQMSAQQPSVVSLGVITTRATTALPQRLAELHRELIELFDEFVPTAVAVEQVFFQTNVRTAMSVGQASGLALAIAAERQCDVVQYTPKQIKNAITGWGGADKLQMQRMVQKRLGLSKLPKPADAADAAALALCYLAMLPLRQSITAAEKKMKSA
ncbi:MAG: crossover junction endodeoxyribonuclease RuvC [Ilumatobacteraceae bacterium]